MTTETVAGEDSDIMKSVPEFILELNGFTCSGRTQEIRAPRPRLNPDWMFICCCLQLSKGCLFRRRGQQARCRPGAERAPGSLAPPVVGGGPRKGLPEMALLECSVKQSIIGWGDGKRRCRVVLELSHRCGVQQAPRFQVCAHERAAIKLWAGARITRLLLSETAATPRQSRRCGRSKHTSRLQIVLPLDGMSNVV